MADYQEGDIFEGSPIELNRWLSPAWAAGCRVEFDGNFATIVFVPPSVLPEPPVEEYFERFTKQVEPELVEDEPIVQAPVEELSVAEDLAPVEEAVREPIPKPQVSRGRPKKTVNHINEVN